MIRHASRRVALPVLTLPVAMIEPSLQTPLVAAVGAAPLLAPSFGSRQAGAAIALSAIAVRADPEHRLASLARDKPAAGEPLRHEPPSAPQAEFDSGNGSCQVRTSLMVVDPTKVAEPEPRRFKRRGSSSRLPDNNTPFC